MSRKAMHRGQECRTRKAGGVVSCEERSGFCDAEGG